MDIELSTWVGISSLKLENGLTKISSLNPSSPTSPQFKWFEFLLYTFILLSHCKFTCKVPTSLLLKYYVAITLRTMLTVSFGLLNLLDELN